MALVELQIRRQAFLDFVKNEINRQRLPSRTLPGIPELSGKLLQRIVCIGASVAPSAGAGQITVSADLEFHHNTEADVRAAGSLQAPLPEEVRKTIPLTFTIAFPQPRQPRLRWSIFFGVIPGRDMPLNLGSDFIAETGAIEADENVVAIRLASNPADVLTDVIVDRLGTSDWALLVSGQVIADVFLRQFSAAIQDAVSDELHIGTPASAAWFASSGGSGPGSQGPFVGCSATLIAIDKCIFDIDVPIDVQLIGRLQPTGPSLVTTVDLSWDPDSTACEILAGLLLTPIASVVIHELAEDGATEEVLGKAKPFENFKEIGRDDDSITYQRQSLLDTPSPRFVLTQSEVTDEGLLTRGTLSLQSSVRKLNGSSTAPSSGLRTDCGRRQVVVEFRPATVSVTDPGVDGGAPQLLPGGVRFDPPDAWVVVQRPSSSWRDLELGFVDPPTGRLPVGTPTSVFLHTDCGLRWVDLGVIPADHPPPTTGDIAQMISQCMAISDPWGLGVMNLHWLVDPPDFLGVFDPVREWTFAAKDLPFGARLEFVAVGPNGIERRLGRVEGHGNVAVHIVTDSNETLQVRTSRGFSAPAPKVSQRWVVPFASMPLENEPVALASFGGVVGVRERHGVTRIVEIGEDGRMQSRLFDKDEARDSMTRAMLKALKRGAKDSKSPWTVPARVERGTVALMHRGQLLVGRALPSSRL